MDLNLQLPVIALPFIFLLGCLLSRRLSNSPPSPWALPLLGHLPCLAGKRVHVTLRKLADKYGPIILLRLGVVRTLVVSSPEIAKEVFRTHDLTFASRPYFTAGEYLAYNFKVVGVCPYGERWRRQRKLFTLELFTTRSVDSLSDVRSREVSFMLASVYESSACVINMKTLLSFFAFNITLTKIALGKRFFTGGIGEESEDEEVREFMEISSEIVDLSVSFHISDFLPRWLRWLNWRIPQLKRLAVRKDRFFQRMVDERRRFKDINDFLGIVAKHEQDDESVKAMVEELLSAGTHTSIATMEWAIAEVVSNPQVLQRLRQELDTVVGPWLVREDDLTNLVYLQAIVKEVLRLHPPAPLMVTHMSTQECQVAGYTVPKGTHLLVNAYAIGRDPKVWKESEVFIPERFIGSSVDVRGQEFDLIPFGSGRRACPAISRALRTVQLAVANLLHAFEWSIADRDNCARKEVLGSKLWPEGPLLNAIATPRLPVDAYNKHENID